METQTKTEITIQQEQLPVVVELALPTMKEGLIKLYTPSMVNETKVLHKPVKSILEEMLSAAYDYEEDQLLRDSLKEAYKSDSQIFIHGQPAVKTLESYLKETVIGDQKIRYARFEIITPEEGGIFTPLEKRSD